MELCLLPTGRERAGRRPGHADRKDQGWRPSSPAGTRWTSSRARVTGSAAGAIATAPNAFLAAPLTRGRPGWPPVASAWSALPPAPGRRPRAPLDLLPGRPEIPLPPRELGLGQPGRDRPVVAVPEGIGVFERHPEPGPCSVRTGCHSAALVVPGTGIGAGLARRAAPRRSSVQHDFVDPDDDGIADHADRCRFEARLPSPPCPGSVPSASRPRVGRWTAPSSTGTRDRGSHPARTAAPPRSRPDARGRPSSRCGSDACSSAQSPARGRSQPFQAAHRPGADVGMAQHRVQGAGWSRSSAASRDQAARSAALAGPRDSRRSRPGLVHRAEQAAHQAVLGLDELSRSRPRHRSPQPGPGSRGAQRVRGDVQAVRWPGRQLAADMRDQLKQVRAVDRRVGEATAAPVAVGVQAAAAAVTTGHSRQVWHSPAIPAAGPGCRDARRRCRGRGGRRPSPVSGAPSYATFSESTCS